MLPTLARRQHIQTQGVAGSLKAQLGRGDIIAFRHPQNQHRVYLKRIVGLPNEYIALKDDRVSINGSPQPEPYLFSGLSREGRSRREYPRQWFTDAREYFVLGDNRGDSEDSRSFGPVADRLIVGRLWFRYWPPRVWPSGGQLPAKTTKGMEC